MSFSAKVQSIKAIILDVDGVMTNGQIGFASHDGASFGTIKFFNVRDGHAIKMALHQQLLVGVISGRDDVTTRQRCEELGMSFVYIGQNDKMVAFEEVLRDFSLTGEECLFVGDDVVDLPVMRRCGLAVTVADGEAEVVPYTDWQTTLGGGQGAVREVIFRVLKGQGRWEQAMARFLGDD